MKLVCEKSNNSEQKSLYFDMAVQLDHPKMAKILMLNGATVNPNQEGASEACKEMQALFSYAKQRNFMTLVQHHADDSACEAIKASPFFNVN